MSPPTTTAFSTSSSSSSADSSTPPPPPHSLIHPSSSHNKRHHSRSRAFRVFRSVFRSFPIIAPVCKFPALPIPDVTHTGPRVTGTLFGYRKGHVTLSIQETPRCLPTLVIELGIQTSALQREMGLGTVRIALECDKRADKDRTKVMDEPLWTMYCNGKKSGYGVRREATEEDFKVMELLKAVSMGAGVLPGTGSSCSQQVEGADGDELAYMRAFFERVVGSRDSQTYYMLSPEGNNGPELSIFFIRV
uniref:Protein MIZU-KUSSEI 1 n=1 Tax=Kalanchoe fedtschenkoi TaxID=63787 RepID=A0A7N0US87_KALFE